MTSSVLASSTLVRPEVRAVVDRLHEGQKPTPPAASRALVNFAAWRDPRRPCALRRRRRRRRPSSGASRPVQPNRAPSVVDERPCLYPAVKR